MDLLKARPTYQRAPTDLEPASQSPPSYELSDYRSLRSFTSKSSIPPVQEYGSDYHLLGDSSPVTTGSKRSAWTIRFEGWRTGASIAALLALFSMAVNLGVALWLASKGKKSAMVEVYNGPCGTVAQADIWVHLAINIISTLLLGGSNYCMQCVSAPTRVEIDRFHTKGKYLDIGVPSVRNLRAVPWSKVALWWALGLSSVPLHLMYNSAFFKSLATNDFNLLVVTEDFVSGSSFNNSVYDREKEYNFRGTVMVDPLEVQQNLSDYIKRDPADCIRDYATSFLSDKRQLVLVVNNDTAVTPSGKRADNPLVYQAVQTFSVPDSFSWICNTVPNDDELLGYEEVDYVCDKYYQKWFSQIEAWKPYGNEVEHCLYEPVEERCSYSANVPIISIVIFCNAVKIVCMYIVATRLTDNPLITVGDALESFLNVPDPTTRRSCMLSRIQVRSKAWNHNVHEDEAFPSIATLRPIRWLHTATRVRWSVTISLFILAISTSFGLFIFSTRAIVGTGASIASLGLGRVNTASIISGWDIDSVQDPTRQIMSSVLIANLPQTILSFLYINLNGLVTSMWLASEYSDFATERKPLRVSNATGAQRSTHFLQLPYKVAVPLMIFSGLLHWLLSQSIFLAVVAEYGSNGELASQVGVASCGFSPLAMILTVSVGLMLVIGTLGLGFLRRLNGGIPLAGSCSAAISAACHRPVWDVDAALKPVMWGVVKQEGVGEFGHCSFTSGEVDPVQEGKMYAGLVGGESGQSGEALHTPP